MAKKSPKELVPAKSAESSLPFLANNKKVDPNLASLFTTSAGPTTVLERSGRNHVQVKTKGSLEEDAVEEDEISTVSSKEDDSSNASDEDEDSEASSDEDSTSEKSPAAMASQQSDDIVEEEPSEKIETLPARKRKRKVQEEQIEDVYMRQIAREEDKEEAKRLDEQNQKRRKTAAGSDDNAGGSSDEDEEDEVSSPVPQHESLAPSKSQVELEKSSRTVFLGNVSTSAIESKGPKKELLDHLSSFLSSLPSSKPPHKVESLRFRSTAYSTAIPKKAAFAKKELLDATTKSTNAYAVYSTQTAAREAAKRLNGTVILGRHLRVDEVAHPAKVDHKRCVFVGNLGFVDDESALQAAAEEKGKPKQKKREPADVEEGLWREFGKCGTVESVRVVRDSKTRVGKGFAYVQFTDENAVEAALLYNEKKFPPMLPRKLRVVRAKAVKRNKKNSAPAPTSNGIYKPKADPKAQSMQGRAVKLLGRAGAAQARSGMGTKSNGVIAPMENFIFEGHRATAAQGKQGFKFGAKGKGKKQGKPTTRSSKRGAAWKASKGNKSS